MLDFFYFHSSLPSLQDAWATFSGCRTRSHCIDHNRSSLGDTAMTLGALPTVSWLRPILSGRSFSLVSLVSLV